jgi:FAD/FMN-containing dehydrogenase
MEHADECAGSIGCFQSSLPPGSRVTATAILEIARLDGGRVRLTPGQLGDLRSRFERPLLRSGDEGWSDAVLLWNGMIAQQPACVLQPTSPQEVASAVTYARENGLLLSVKGAGHNIAGTSIAEGCLMLDMSRMRDVVVDPSRRLAIAGPGCLLQDIDRATQRHGLATVLGFISEVGVAGLTLGGGLGYLTRRFGWSVDNLDEVEIVTADGEIRIANAGANADLFWAVRGGGGNFGVVTRFTFRLHSVGPAVYGGLIAWPFERAAEILAAYQRITREAPLELTVILVLLRAPEAPFVPLPWQHKRLCAMAICYTGDLSKTEDVMAPVRALPEPVVDILREQPYTQVQSYLDSTEPAGAQYYWKTDYLLELTNPLLAALAELFRECPVPEADIGIIHLGGALNTRAADDGAVGNRDARFVVGVKGKWPVGEPGAVMYRQWVRAAWQRLRPFSTGSTYINFQTADEDDARIRATYGANFDRLVQVKQKYDPNNLFRVNRNIRAME